jgi:hypothetical protein
VLDGGGVHVRGRDGGGVADGLGRVVVGEGGGVVGAVDLCCVSLCVCERERGG